LSTSIPELRDDAQQELIAASMPSGVEHIQVKRDPEFLAV